MGKIALDSSVIIAWLINDSEKEGEAQELILQLIQAETIIVAPKYLLLEVINTLYWKHYAEADIHLMLKRVTDLEIEWVESDEIDLVSLVKVMWVNKLTAYDAHFLWVAEENNCQLVTYDRALLKADKNRCIIPRQYLEQAHV